jgi:preprotein translocase subunit YajC
MDIATFFGQYGLIIILFVLLIFMFWSSRRRMAKQKLEQEAKARQTVPGAEVLLQGGLYGTIVAYDTENLDQPAIVEIAPGVQIKVHSQSILRIVSPTDVLSEDEFLEAETDAAEYAADVADGYETSISDDRAIAAERAEEKAEKAAEAAKKAETDTEPGTKPQA